MRHADRPEQIGRPASPLPQRPPLFEHRDLHVFERGEGGQQMKRLEDKTNVLGPKARGIRQPAERFTTKPDLAGIWRVERSEEMEQGRLAAAACPHQSDKFSLVDSEGDAAQSLDLPVVVIAMHAIHLEQNWRSIRSWRWAGHVRTLRDFLKRTGVEAQVFHSRPISAGQDFPLRSRAG